MAVPVLAWPKLTHEIPLRIKFLREWLQGSWALLFSHPDDFASYGFESDRWVMQVRQAFSATGIRPLTLASPDSEHAFGWIYEIGGAAVDADDMHGTDSALDDSERAFRSTITNIATRFAMVVDDSLRTHRTFSYSARDRLPSPIELVWSAEALRQCAVKRGMKVLRCSSASSEAGIAVDYERSEWICGTRVVCQLEIKPPLMSKQPFCHRGATEIRTRPRLRCQPPLDIPPAFLKNKPTGDL